MQIEEYNDRNAETEDKELMEELDELESLDRSLSLGPVTMGASW